MNDLSLYITVSAVVLGILSAVLNFTGRQKYKDQADFFERSNHELREQNTAFRDEKIELNKELAKAQAESAQKDKTIEELKPFSEVVKIMSNNHKQIMTSLTDLSKKLTGKIDGRSRAQR